MAAALADPLPVVDPKEGALICTGHLACFQKAVELLEANGLPGGLLPLDDILEVGFVEATGYFWLKQRKPKQHYFPLISRSCHYAQEITGYFRNGCLRELTGVKTKELLIWFTITDMFTNDNHPGEIYFKTQTGLGKWQPAEAFTLQT